MLPVATTWPVLRFQTTLSARSRSSRRNIRTSPLAVTISASISYSSVPVENWIWFGSSGGACSGGGGGGASCRSRSEEHTSELQSLMRISYAVFCLRKKTHQNKR